MSVLTKDAIQTAKNADLVFRAASYAELQGEIDDHPVDATKLFDLAQEVEPSPERDDLMPPGTLMLWMPDAPFRILRRPTSIGRSAHHVEGVPNGLAPFLRPLGSCGRPL